MPSRSRGDICCKGWTCSCQRKAIATLLWTTIDPQSMMTASLLPVTLAYLLGSIPFGYLLVRFIRHEDVRAAGSGNIGATNVARAGGKVLGILTLLLDIGKGFAAVLLAFLIAHHKGLERTDAYHLAAFSALAAVIGHIFPVWLGFHGGKGVATSFGVFLGLAPRAALCILGVFILVFLVTKFVSLASILAAASFPLFAFYFMPHPGKIVVFTYLLIPLLICIKHHSNIGRLLAGTESRFASRSRKVEA